MPINDARFKKNDPGAVTELLDFLRPNFYKAFSLKELLEELKEREVKISADELANLLSSLEYGSRIVSKVVDGETYYQLRKVRGFVPLKKFK
jgi:predicted AAA+ superfamily ATPase